MQYVVPSKNGIHTFCLLGRNALDLYFELRNQPSQVADSLANTSVDANDQHVNNFLTSERKISILFITCVDNKAVRVQCYGSSDC